MIVQFVKFFPLQEEGKEEGKFSQQFSTMCTGIFISEIVLQIEISYRIS